MGQFAGYIQIQNDAITRTLEISHSPEYWKSRECAMRWAIIYRTQPEIGPLSKAATGNEGGWIYSRHLRGGNCCLIKAAV